MVKHPKRRSNLRRVRVASSSAVGALASLDVVINAITQVSANRYRAISFICSYNWSNKSAADDAAVFGLAHSDYSAAEIEECLESQAGIDQGDKVAQEQANRLVRLIGQFSSGGEGGVSGGAQFNDGKTIKVRLNWLMGIGDTITLWIRNASGTVFVTGSNITIQGDLWVKD